MGIKLANNAVSRLAWNITDSATTIVLVPGESALLPALDYDLHAVEHESYTFPVDGLYWFDSAQEARSLFGLLEPEVVHQVDPN